MNGMPIENSTRVRRQIVQTFNESVGKFAIRALSR